MPRALMLPFVLCTLLAAAPCRAEELEAACERFSSCYNDGGHDVCWKRQEAQLLRKRDAKASREGDALVVLTLRGPVIFTDTLSEIKVDGALYRYLGYFPDIGQHLVGVLYYEGNNFVLVSHATADAVYTGDTPHVSPSRKRIVVADANEAFHPNAIRIWTLEKGRLREEHGEMFKTFSANFVRWEDDNSFTVDEYDTERSKDCPDRGLSSPRQHFTYRWEGGRLSRTVAREPNFRCTK